MPFRSHRSYQDCKQFCRSSSICGSFFAMIWCVNMLVSAVTSLTYVSDYFEEWIETEAIIIGRNVTVHYRSSGSNPHNTSGRDRRFLIGSNIPNFTAEDDFDFLGGNETDLFGNNNVNLTNNNNNNNDNNSTNQWPDDGDGGLLGDLDSWNNLGNDNSNTDPQDNNNNNNNNNSTAITTTNNKTDIPEDDSNSNEEPDWNNEATLTPNTLPPAVEPGSGGRLVYCAEVRFKVNENHTITAVSDTYCSYDPEDIVVGRVFRILFNPDQPTEIIEESLYEHAQNTLRLTVGVTIFFTVGYLLCSIYLWRSQPDIARGMLFPHHTGHDLDLEMHGSNEITQTPEEREALMRTTFHFQTVLEDLSNTDAATIRRLSLNNNNNNDNNNDKGEEEEEEKVIQCSNGECECDKLANRAHAEKMNNGRLEVVDIEAPAQKEDSLQQQQQPSHEEEEEQGDLELDLSKKEHSRDEISSSTSNTETEAETDTDAGSNNQGSAANESNDTVQKPQQPESSQEPEPAWSLAGATNLISSWTNAALAPSAPECCICLETYQSGDKICTSRSAEGCDHVFHQHCIEAWLHRHDACPLCRVDLMNTNNTT